jgi:hypothetical protein
VKALAGRRRVALALLGVAVTLFHGLLAERLAALLPEPDRPPIERLQPAFVRELQPAEPLPPAPAAPKRRARAAAPRALAASAPPPEAAASVPEASAAELPPAEAAPQWADAGADAASAAEPAASAPGFEWPLATRLSYTLTGDVRGPVEGEASVEWLRESDRYQVRVEVIVGPRFAPLMQRRMVSEGLLGPEGLVPRRYDEETQIAFAPARRAAVDFDDDEEEVVLANGRRLPALPGVQDTASQFVQLTWLFATGAAPLRAGGALAVPLALPRRLDRWLYDVVGVETLDTPFGRVDAWRLKPRREGTASALSIETWFAPSLQYLPVRIVIRQGPDSHIDLMIARLPQQAAQ